MKSFLYWGLLTGSLLLPLRAQAAQPTSPSSDSARRPFAGQREFGFGPTTGFYSGVGAMVGVGSVFGVWLSGGYLPLFITGGDRHDDDVHRDLYWTVQGNADLALTLWHPKERSSIGLIAGYKLNTHLGHGAGAGVTFAYDLRRKLAIRALGGLAVFPRAERELRKHDYPRDRDPFLPGVHAGVNLGLVFYP